MKQPALLKRNAIDERKWNALIGASVQLLPYAYTWYLDAVAENWEALILGDYEAVMPLPYLRKLGVKCVYQPYYCQQLGVFSKTLPDSHVLTLFIDALQRYPYIHINLNPTAGPVAGTYHFTKRKNLLLATNSNYTTLRKGFADNHRRNIAKAEKGGLLFVPDADPKLFATFCLKNIDREKENFKPQHEKAFKALCKAVSTNKAGRFFAATLPDGQISTAVLLLLHYNRAINIINVSSAAGKKNGSAHFLFNRLIQLLAEENKGTILDFEGSSVPGVARFYEGFGAQPEFFYNHQTNLLKKLSQRFS